MRAGVAKRYTLHQIREAIEDVVAGASGSVVLVMDEERL